MQALLFTWQIWIVLQSVIYVIIRTTSLSIFRKLILI